MAKTKKTAKKTTKTAGAAKRSPKAKAKTAKRSPKKAGAKKTKTAKK
jgi:hypothetical protein